MRICKCGTIETEENPFYKKSAICRVCYYKKKNAPHFRENIKAQEKRRRQDPNKRALYIVQDSRRYDKKHGMENNLTVEVVRDVISHGCHYCGEKNLKITLDRKDNSLGHITENVVPCCIRCNLLRRNMPYEAWAFLVPAIKEARELGLFGNWSCEIHRNM